jgi:2-polyprenyl-6-methoxyphenol hydroxylase-like FAD-dependent oxidoreductase
MEIMKTDVLIIGAGPSGLSLACQLLRYGVDFIIIEKNEGITPYSKAIGVHARTLEILDQIGLAQEAVANGTVAETARLIIDGEMRGELRFSDVGKGMSPFPFVLMLEQSKTERLLYEYLQNHQKDVLWKTELETFKQDTEGVVARVKASDQETLTISAKYIVGCDGPKSFVRHTLGLEFEGSTFERIFYVADAQVDWQMSHDTLHVCFSPDSFVVFFPLKGEKRYRIVGLFPEEFNKDEGDILYQEIETRIKSETRLDLDIHDVEWFSTYKVHTRHVNKFSAGRGFLAGDSAHIHTPAGAQGMNTGIQDGYNLAWKIALVLQGTNEKLLETYNEERLENAKRLVKTTDRFFGFAAGTDWLMNFLRLHVLPPIAKHIFSLDVVRRFAFPAISQIGINYRHSSVSHHAGDEDFQIKAGDRMPYFLINGKSVFDRLREPKFHWLIFSDRKSDGGQELTTELEDKYRGLIDFDVIPLDPQVIEVFGANQSFGVLLRPDNYIAFITMETSPGGLTAYLNRFVEQL